MPTNKPSRSSKNKNISINGDVRDSNVFIGDNNTFIKKFFNIFKSDSETLEHRNRRILLNHLENAWIKGVLDASLHGAALLDLGIKKDPNAVTQYPWTLKKESTDETLPAGTSMLEIFDSIGMGRSLLILGAPGSGKTTMLLELARGLIARAREDVTQPIPMVFNLASWTERLTLADWLAQELNNLYSVPRKTAPDWVKGNKLLLLLDGLDEVRQESRANCVGAINAFRKQNGLTSLAVCSRSQDYADLNAKLSFEGAIEVQPLTQGQIAEFFNRFGDEMAGIKQALERDSALREMAETPLFLSIMNMAYRDKSDVKVLVSRDEKVRRKHLFDTYIKRMFERHLKNTVFDKQDNLRWLSWLASRMIQNNLTTFQIMDIQPSWLKTRVLTQMFNFTVRLINTLVFVMLVVIAIELLNFQIMFVVTLGYGFSVGLGLVILDVILLLVMNKGKWFPSRFKEKFRDGLEARIVMMDNLKWSWKKSKNAMRGLVILSLVLGLTAWVQGGLIYGLIVGVIAFPLSGIYIGFNIGHIEEVVNFGRRIISTFFASLYIGLIFGLFFGLVSGLIFGQHFGLVIGFITGLCAKLYFGERVFYQHFLLRFLLTVQGLIPTRITPFLDHCVDLIFLRRVGGGYIFIHRLLMEHFAEMYVEPPTSKGN